KTPPRSLVESMESRHAIAPAASPARVEIVRDPGATSSRVPHFGHSMSFERAAASGAEISVLQCGHMRTATPHLQVRTPTIIEVAPRWKGGMRDENAWPTFASNRRARHSFGNNENTDGAERLVRLGQRLVRARSAFPIGRYNDAVFG